MADEVLEVLLAAADPPDEAECEDGKGDATEHGKEAGDDAHNERLTSRRLRGGRCLVRFTCRDALELLERGQYGTLARAEGFERVHHCGPLVRAEVLLEGRDEGNVCRPRLRDQRHLLFGVGAKPVCHQREGHRLGFDFLLGLADPEEMLVRCLALMPEVRDRLRHLNLLLVRFVGQRGAV